VVRFSTICTGRPFPRENITFRGWVGPWNIVGPEGLCQLKNSNDTIGNRTRDLPACSAVPQIPHTQKTKSFYKDIVFKCDVRRISGYLHFRKNKTATFIIRMYLQSGLLQSITGHLLSRSQLPQWRRRDSIPPVLVSLSFMTSIVTTVKCSSIFISEKHWIFWPESTPPSPPPPPTPRVHHFYSAFFVYHS